MRLAVPLACLIAAGGCVDDESLVLSEDTQSVVTDNRIALNRIALNRIALNRIALNRIALNRIALNNLQANLASIGDLLDTHEGREVFSFVVSCALEDGDVLVVNHPTQGPLNFLGEVGLAPRWETRAMTNSDQRWVSACLLSRVNNNNVTVQVSLRGPDDALDTTAQERAAWPLEEGAFFGDVFQPPHRPLEMYACRGRDQAAGPETGDMDARDCTEPDPANPGKTLCGMTYAGDCADFAPPKNRYACERKLFDSYYVNCTPTASFGSGKKPKRWGHHWGHGWGRDGWGDDDDHHGHGHHGHHGHGHGHCGGGHGHGHDDDEIDEVITTYLQSAI
jgi:hypothetical protein